MEKNEWFPFKGTKNINESLKETAIREIYEETCGLVKLDNIHLNCTYSTKRKYYHIGLVFVNFNILQNFHKKRNFYKICNNIKISSEKYLEKIDIKYFNINNINLYKFHNISKIPINFYKNFLLRLQQKLNSNLINNNDNNFLNILKKIQPTNIENSPNINILTNNIINNDTLVL